MDHVRPVPDGAPRGGRVGAPPTSPTCSSGRRRGDQAAFAAAVRRDVAARVYGLALRVVRDPAQAEEVTQEAFLESGARPRRYDPARGSAVSLAAHHRPPQGRRPGPLRRGRHPPRHDVPPAQTTPVDARRDRRGRDRPRSRPSGSAARSPTLTDGPARGPRARLLRRLHAHGGGDHAGPAGRHRQDPNPRRTDPAAGHDGGGVMSMNDIHALSGAYAVDALDDLERARFEQPPRRLRRLPRRGRQPPRGRRAARPQTAATAARRACATGCSPTSPTVRPLPPLDAGPTTPAADRTGRVDRARRRRPVAAGAAWSPPPRSSPWSAPAARRRAAAGRRRRPPQVAQPTAAEQVLRRAGRRRQTRTLPDGGQGHRDRVRVSSGKAVVITEDMPPPPAGKVYELWLSDADRRMVPAGLMTADEPTRRRPRRRPPARRRRRDHGRAGRRLEQPTSEPIAAVRLREAPDAPHRSPAGWRSSAPASPGSPRRTSPRAPPT